VKRLRVQRINFSHVLAAEAKTIFENFLRRARTTVQSQTQILFSSKVDEIRTFPGCVLSAKGVASGRAWGIAPGIRLQCKKR
jgi:hypothetical protein